MSLLTVATSVAEEVGVDVPSIIIGSSDRTAKQLLRLINHEGRILANKGWTILQKEYTFTTDGSAYVALPTDFDYLLDESAWDRDNYWKMRGGLTAAEWQAEKSGLLVSVSSRLSFRIKPLSGVNKFYLDPTPASGVDGVLEYVSCHWVKNESGTEFRGTYTLDTDVALVSEKLVELGAIWRFKNAKGLAYLEEYNEYQDEVDKAFARDGGKPALNMGRVRMRDINIPEGNFG